MIGEIIDMVTMSFLCGEHVASKPYRKKLH